MEKDLTNFEKELDDLKDKFEKLHIKRVLLDYVFWGFTIIALCLYLCAIVFNNQTVAIFGWGFTLLQTCFLVWGFVVKRKMRKNNEALAKLIDELNTLNELKH